MTKLVRSLADESVLLLGLISALCVALGVGEATTTVVLAAVPLALALVVRQVASSPSTVVAVAHKTAELLTTPIVGPIGMVTEAGNEVVNMVVSDVGGLVGKLAPKVG